MNYPRVMQAALERPWALLPEKMAQIQSFLKLKAVGGTVPEAEIAALLEARSDRVSDLFYEDEGEKQGPSYALFAGPAAPRGGRAVAVIPIHGIMTQRGGISASSEPLASTTKTAALLRQAHADPNVGAILLEVDSPGGEVFGTAELAQLVANLVAQGTKPIVAIASSMAASAAYWVASQAEELIVTPGGLVGSIGVYTMHEDVSLAAEQQGVKVNYISAGKYKVEGNPFEPLGDEARAAMQQRVDDYYGMFVNAVARGRGTTAAAVRAGYGEGRVLSAKRAQSEGLVDRIDTMEATLERLASGGYRKPRRGAGAEDPSVSDMLADADFLSGNLEGLAAAERGEGVPAEEFFADAEIARRRLRMAVGRG